MRRFILSSALLLAAPTVARAQMSGDGYLFGAPDARLSIHTGYARATAGSDVFTQAMSDLTLNTSDFGGMTIGGELAFTLTPRLDLAFQVDYVKRSKDSEYRNLVDNNNKPIQQTTAFTRVPVTANLRAYLAPNGRSIGKLAWIPAEIVPWIGVGGGAMWYNWEQSGDFVDTRTMLVYSDAFHSDGWAPAVQGMGGLDVTLTPRIAFTADLHYTWARGNLGRDYVGYDKIDLSGLSTGLGLTLRL